MRRRSEKQCFPDLLATQISTTEAKKAMDLFQCDQILLAKMRHEFPACEQAANVMPCNKPVLSCANSIMNSSITDQRNSTSKSCKCSDPSLANALGNDLLISPRQLAEIMSFAPIVPNCPCLPIIDCRSQMNFGVEHIRTSRNVNCRAKLIARKLLSKRLEEMEPSLAVLFDRFDDVILYDQSTNVSTEEQIRSSPLFLVVQAAQKSNKRVHIIQGGFDAVKSEYPHLVEFAVQMPRDLDNLPPMPSSPQPIDKENFLMNEIFPHVFVGNALDAQNCARLTQFGISHVINATPDLPFCRERKCKQLRIAILDLPSENIFQHFELAIQFIDDALRSESHNVLVHCSAGISRSPTLVLAYMIKRQRLTLEGALRTMRCSRSIIDPNFSFILQLRSWEKQCLACPETIDEKRHTDSSAMHRSSPRSRSSSRYCGSTSTSKSEAKSCTDSAIIVN